MLEPLFLMLLKLGLLMLPLTILWLATRRLLLSRSANAWLYAATAVFALITTVGLTPWAFGLGNSHPIIFIFASMIPAVWYSVATLCNSHRNLRYDSELERTFMRFAALAQAHARARPKPGPLILEGAEWPEAPKPVFRHRSSEPSVTPPLAFCEDHAPFVTDATDDPKPKAPAADVPWMEAHAHAPAPGDRAAFTRPAPDATAEAADIRAINEPAKAHPLRESVNRASETTRRILDITRTMRRKSSSEDRRIKLLPAPDKVGKASLHT